MEEYLRELRLKTPDEIKRYQKIISNKDAILEDAQAKADALIADAQTKAQELVTQHEIMQKAYAQANETINAANKQAQEILIAQAAAITGSYHDEPAKEAEDDNLLDDLGEE